ncbi:hypothetical protein J6Y73_01575 [bacterium]|nr:hypothetical protein [bacterium]
MEKTKTKKVLKIIGDVLFFVVIALILFIAVMNLRSKKNNGIPNIFGTAYVEVLSGSMDGDKPDSFAEGDLVIAKIVNDKNREEVIRNLKVGDIVTYIDYTIVKEGMIISHRITSIANPIEEGDPFHFPTYVVQGDNLDYGYGATNVPASRILAVYKSHVKGLGNVLGWFGTPAGFFVIVVLPCILFLIFEVYKFIRVLIEYQNEKNKKNDSESERERNINLTRETLNELVKSGILTQEQADQKLNEYIQGLESKQDEAVEQA